VTITKSMTLDGDGTVAGVLVSGTNGIVINAGANDTVVLRNLDINGIGGAGSINGVNILSAGTVIIDKCRIYGFDSAAPSGNGILVDNSSGNVRVFVIDSVIRKNTTGIYMHPSSAGGVDATVTRTALVRNGTGFFGDITSTTGPVIASISDSQVTGSLLDGIFAKAGASGNLRIAASNNVITDNGYLNDPSAVNAGGVHADGANAAIRILNNHITDNRFGVNITNSGKIYSFGGNMITTNTTNGTFTSTQATQ
jgi:hypothetical protein